MKIETLKIGAIGAVIGAIMLWAFGFQYAGWVTPTYLYNQERMAALEATVIALTPYCVANAMDEPSGVTEIKNKQKSWQRRDLVKSYGWGVYPPDASDSTKKRINEACAEYLYNQA